MLPFGGESPKFNKFGTEIDRYCLIKAKFNLILIFEAVNSTVHPPYLVFDINKPEGPVKVFLIVSRNGRIESVINVSLINEYCTIGPL